MRFLNWAKTRVYQHLMIFYCQQTPCLSRFSRLETQVLISFQQGKDYTDILSGFRFCPLMPEVQCYQDKRLFLCAEV